MTGAEMIDTGLPRVAPRGYDAPRGCRIFKAKNGYFFETCEARELPDATIKQLATRGVSVVGPIAVAKTVVVIGLDRLAERVEQALDPKVMLLAPQTCNMAGDAVPVSCKVIIDVQAFDDGFGVRVRSRGAEEKDEEDGGYKENDNTLKALNRLGAMAGAQQVHDTVFVFDTVSKVVHFVRATL